jgi:hypothetical protein
MKKDWLTLLSLMGFWFGALIAFIIFIMNLPVYLVIAVAILSLISGFCFFTQVLFLGTVLFRDIGILHDNASLIKSSGRMIASSLCASNLYAMGRGMSLPVVKVSLYPKGIWIKLPFIKPIGIALNPAAVLSLPLLHHCAEGWGKESQEKIFNNNQR